MARAKKPEEKGGATLQIDVDSFVRTRDSIVTGLQTLQDAIRILSSAYIKHTNAVLGDHGASLDVDAALAKLGEIPLLRLGDDLGRTASPWKFSTETAPEKKERKKRQHDPNAPKRPLTPFFLYMQTARPIIARDLGADVPKGAVSVEGQRRWQTMSENDKQLWTDAYKENLRLYHARIHSYKAGNANAKDMDETEAAQYAIEHDITVPALDHPTDVPLVGEVSGTAFLEEDIEAEPEQELEPDLKSDPEAELELEHEPTPPPKTPKSKPNRKQRAKTVINEIPADHEVILPSPGNIKQVASVDREKTPEKKRKRSKRKEEIEGQEEPKVESLKAATKSRKKKSKNE